MISKADFKYIVVTVAALIIMAMLILGGCQGSKMNKEDSSGQAKTSVADSEKGAAQLWSENCMRCHNLRVQSSYSDAQWQVAMHHMRVRGDLTAEEHRRILEYLQASN